MAHLNGKRSYLTAVLVGLSQMIVLGLFACFSVFLESFKEDGRLGNPTQTGVSFVQSISLGLVPTAGVVAGMVSDRFGPRVALTLASLLIACHQLLTPLANSFTSFVIIYSGTLGLACAMISAPGPATLETWFSPEVVPIGIGLTEAITALGTSFLPLLASSILSACEGDWRATFTYMAIICIIPLGCSCFISKRSSEQVPLLSPIGVSLQSGIDIEEVPLGDHLKNPLFISLVVCQFLFGYCYFGMLFVTVPFARMFGKPGTEYESFASISLSSASALMTFFGTGNAIGALGLGVLSSRLNTTAVFVAGMPLCAICVLLMGLSTSFVEIALAITPIGVLSAAGLTCLPSMMVERFAGPHINTLMAWSFAGFGCGGLCGTPLSSYLQLPSGSYSNAIVVIAVAFVAASVSAILPMLARPRSQPLL